MHRGNKKHKERGKERYTDTEEGKERNTHMKSIVNKTNLEFQTYTKCLTYQLLVGLIFTKLLTIFLRSSYELGYLIYRAGFLG
jgi:outer membrane receptor for monomeric catechols